MKPTRHGISKAFLFAALLATPPAQAEKADRDKPVKIEADRVSVDDLKKVQVFEGNVQLSMGTLTLRAERIVVTQDAQGYQRGVATGSAGALPRFRQKREGSEEFIEGEAERIEHDAKLEKTEFHHRAWMKSGLDEVRGKFISYDAKSENYVVSGGATPGAAGRASSGGERVRAIIQPKNRTPASDAVAPTSPSSKGATTPIPSHQEKTTP